MLAVLAFSVEHSVDELAEAWTERRSVRCDAERARTVEIKAQRERLASKLEERR